MGVGRKEKKGAKVDRGMARMYCEECGETIEEECGYSTPQAGICEKCFARRSCTCNCLPCIEGRHCGVGYPNPDGTPTLCLFPSAEDGPDDEDDWDFDCRDYPV